MARKRKINPNTKYYPPRLIKKLEYVSSYPFTLIEAPSGFGKTTLLEYFFDEQVAPSIPRSIYDFESDEPLFIWQQLCECIGKIDSHCGNRLKKCGIPDEDNLWEIHQILRELECPNEAYIWLDNYKRWENEFAGDFLTQLAQHGGKNLHIIVSSQPISASQSQRLMLKSSYWNLKDEDLVFREEDVAAYFKASGVLLSAEQVRQVYELTEGWIMALCLQLLSFLEYGAFEQGGMTALMENAFWAWLTPAEQEFLLRISIFQKFSLGQATQLSGLSSNETDRMLRDKRYFIHYDAESRFFYPHSQLRILLEKHFNCLAPEIKKQIYLDGARLAEQEKNRRNTLRFYYAADEWESILKLPLNSYELADILTGDLQHIVLDILDKTPMPIKLRHPHAMLSMAFCLFVMGDTKRLMEFREELADIIQQSTLDASEREALTGELELLLSFLEFNRISDMSKRHRKALRLLHGPARLISAKSIWTFGSPSILYLYWRESGKLDEELEEMDECMPIYYELSHGHGFGAELIMRAEAYMMRGQLSQALPLCYEALFVANQHHQDSIHQCGLFLLCRIFFQQGKLADVEHTLSTMHEMSNHHREDLSRYTYDLAVSYMALLRRKVDEVSPWLLQGDITDKRLVLMVQPLGHIIYGQCLLLQKEYLKLLGASHYFMGLSKIFPNLLPQVYFHIYCAIAYEKLGNTEEAVQQLQEAIDLAMPDRVYLPFAEMYADIKFLLLQVVIGGEGRKEIEKLAHAFMDSENERVTLTPREQEIQALLKENLTNKEIAERMGLSPNTVRNAISAMLRKYGFKTRVQLRDLEN